jgi:hypothetical protein
LGAAVALAVSFWLTHTSDTGFSIGQQVYYDGLWILTGFCFPAAVATMIFMARITPRVRWEAGFPAISPVPALIAGVCVPVVAIVGTVLFNYFHAVVAPSDIASRSAAAIPMDVKTTTLSDKALTPFKAMYAVERKKWHLAPMPGKGTVMIVTPKKGSVAKREFDARVNVNWDHAVATEPIKDIHFRKGPKGYEWIGEIDTYESTDTNIEGDPNEEAVIAYMTQSVRGYPVGVYTSYSNGPRMEYKKGVTIDDVAPHLRSMGYAVP